MPFRTRDFALFLLLVAFLVSGIASTVHSDLSSKTLVQSASVFEASSSDEEVVYDAVLEEDTTDTRGERLKSLRSKIAKLVLSEPEEEEVAVTETPEPTTEEVPNSILLCPNYATSNPAWSPAGIEFEIVEGARLVYRPLIPEITINELGEEVSGPDREILLQLPLRSFPQTNKSCIPTDVIGIAIDGSLLRNNEHTAYQVFGAETRVGYALDGFPIFGTANAGVALDACGGATVAGEYRYFLTPEREGVLGCFSGQPISL